MSAPMHWLLGDIRAKAEPQKAPEMYECPDCAFGFDARHTQADGTHSCPNCSEARLLEACRAVLACREDGTFGPDGQQGFKMLADAVAKAEGK